ncbi:PhoH family protein [bacterium]|nr:PhoH family protein [FCB group bacterium]MBL7191269.1 PhoH family protein [bacterium]
MKENNQPDRLVPDEKEILEGGNKSVKRSKASERRKKRKLFVLDTNVLLHDPNAIWHFEDNDLAVPITVLEEIDQFKRGSDTINFNARDAARTLDELAAKGGLIQEGVPLGDGLGQLSVLVSGTVHEKVKSTFLQDIPDHRILSAALIVKEQQPKRDVVLVSKDVSLRLKARSLGLDAQDYESDKVPELDKLYKGRYELEGVDDELINRLFQPPFNAPIGEFDIDEIYPNAYFILKGSSKSAIGRFDLGENAITRVEKRTAYGIYPRNSEQTFALDALMNPDIQLVTLSGKAGTGKTLLALAGALESRRKYHQIFLARPIIALGNRDIGFLPGDIANKIGPYMQPLWDNLAVIRSQFKKDDPPNDTIQNMLDTEKLTISALAYIRGRSLNKIYFIVDESQNLTGHEVKTIITRAGEGTKIILTGDPQQIDSPYLDSRSNGLTRLIDKMKGQDIYAHVTLEKGERSLLSDLASNLL